MTTRSTEQAHVVFGMRALASLDPDRYAFGVLNQALGGGMSSRLFQSIRRSAASRTASPRTAPRLRRLRIPRRLRRHCSGPGPRDPRRDAQRESTSSSAKGCRRARSTRRRATSRDRWPWGSRRLRVACVASAGPSRSTVKSPTRSADRTRRGRRPRTTSRPSSTASFAKRRRHSQWSARTNPPTSRAPPSPDPTRPGPGLPWDVG